MSELRASENKWCTFTVWHASQKRYEHLFRRVCNGEDRRDDDDRDEDNHDYYDANGGVTTLSWRW